MDTEGNMSHKPMTESTLFYGDNLFILREHISSESIDLIYLDPPFNLSRNYAEFIGEAQVLRKLRLHSVLDAQLTRREPGKSYFLTKNSTS